jgi:hypothetical protein
VFSRVPNVLENHRPVARPHTVHEHIYEEGHFSMHHAGISHTFPLQADCPLKMGNSECGHFQKRGKEKKKEEKKKSSAVLSA